MIRKEKEIKDREEIESIIRKASICRLGLSFNDMPYVVPLNFGYEDNCLYFHSAKEGKKMDILKKNPKICFEFDIDTQIVEDENPCRWSMRFKSVIGIGKAQIIHDLLAKKEALNIIMGHYAGFKTFEFDDEKIDSVAIIKVDIKKMSGKKSGY